MECQFCTNGGMLTNVNGDEAVCHCVSGDQMLAYIAEQRPQFLESYTAARSTGPEDATAFLADQAARVG